MGVEPRRRRPPAPRRLVQPSQLGPRPVSSLSEPAPFGDRVARLGGRRGVGVCVDQLGALDHVADRGGGRGPCFWAAAPRRGVGGGVLAAAGVGHRLRLRAVQLFVAGQRPVVAAVGHVGGATRAGVVGPGRRRGATLWPCGSGGGPHRGVPSPHGLVCAVVPGAVAVGAAVAVAPTFPAPSCWRLVRWRCRPGCSCPC